MVDRRVRLAVDVGSVTFRSAHHLRGDGSTPAHPSSTLASMGSALPYAIAAEVADPDRPVVALVGDGAMQTNGINELVTVAHLSRRWADSRLVVLEATVGRAVPLLPPHLEERRASGSTGRWPTSRGPWPCAPGGRSSASWPARATRASGGDRERRGRS